MNHALHRRQCAPLPLAGRGRGWGLLAPVSATHSRQNTDTPPHSRDTLCPSYRRKFMRPSNEGAGKAGCPLHPRSVCEKWKHTEVTTGGGGSSRPSLRNGFNGFLRALPGDRAFLPPSPAQCESIVANLTPASGRQDHTTSPSASARFVLRASRVHRIPHSTFVTIAKRPSDRGGDSGVHKADFSKR